LEQVVQELQLRVLVLRAVQVFTEWFLLAVEQVGKLVQLAVVVAGAQQLLAE